jgi:Ca2+-binding RTX toxin-like protein
MRHVQDNAEEAVRRVIDALGDGHYRYEMDSGAVIEVAVTVDRVDRSATIDFTGTSPQLTTNFNAPSSVATAAVLYVFRTLVDDDIPLNSGCLKPLEVLIPEGCMLRPRYPAAVVAGNVETSQCITDALYGALGVLAASQGTMNNFRFGNERYQYYETVAGGSGAGEGFDGADVVQTHMTNSRLTDPEVLEWRFPVRLESFEIRHGSGGRGSDNVLGDEGNDFLIDGPTREFSLDKVSGGDGNDVFLVENVPAAKDLVTCGDGFDRVLADTKDLVARNCERVRIARGSREEVLQQEDEFLASIPPSFFEGLHPLEG